MSLPTLSDIIESENKDKDKGDALTVLLNQPPPATWIKINNKIPYIPIDKVEYLLSKIFGKWKSEIKKVDLIANSIVVTVRLHYKDPISLEDLYHDGVGAAPLQTNKGASATDLSALRHNSVQLSTPCAESFAIKDAAEKIGRIFGKDLNRKDVVSYDNILPDSFKFENPQISEA